MTDLLKLADRVEASRSTLEELVNVFPQIIEYDGGYADILNSLDAVHALHDLVLPEWTVIIEIFSNFSIVKCETTDLIGNTKGKASTTAAAWLAALLRAVHSQEKNNDQ